jgi:hydroxyacyl-ACP dehydratase HTD2-like protein with hotdog domain
LDSWHYGKIPGEMTVDIDLAHLQGWIGRRESGEDWITLFPVAALAATLDRKDSPPQPGDPLPPLWHWLYWAADHDNALAMDATATLVSCP